MPVTLWKALRPTTRALGKRVLLDTLALNADHIDERFGPGEHQVHGYCGHPEVELGLVKLFRPPASAAT